jgi:hypothetical protein
MVVILLVMQILCTVAGIIGAILSNNLFLDIVLLAIPFISGLFIGRKIANLISNR